MKTEYCTIEKDDLSSFVESMDRARKCIAGIAAAVDMINPSELREDSEKLLDMHGIATGLSSILAACANEMRVDLEQFERRFAEQEEREAR